MASSSPAGGGFSWVRARPLPPGWAQVRIADGATLGYPPGWRAIRSDKGTASAARFGLRGRFVGYLNLTPQQGGETLANWGHFRVSHNADEHQHNVRLLAVSGKLPFRGGHAVCVRDSYVTKIQAKFIEIACLIRVGGAGNVVVGAAPPSAWPQISATLERAIAAVTV